MTKVSGRVPTAPGSREPSPSVSAASGFDPSRGDREQRFERIQVENGCTSIVCASYLSDNCACMDEYERTVFEKAACVAEATVSGRKGEEPSDSRSRHIAERIRALRDSDGSGEAGETGTGSTEGDSAGPKGIAQPTSEGSK